MHAGHHEALLAKPGPGGRRIGVRIVVAILVTTLAWGCGTQVTPTPSASPAQAATATPAATPAPTPSPTPAYVDTLTIGWNPALDPYGTPYADYGFRVAIDAAQLDLRQINLLSTVYSGLYRYDATFNAVPDLADGPCLPQGDGTVLRCKLIATTFQDGTPLTADDVAYSYQLFMRPPFQYYTWWTRTYKEARVVDPRTVDIVLTSADPTFLTSVMPWLPILPRHAVEASYATFLAATKDLRAADLMKLADAIDADLARDPPVCAPRLDVVAALLAKIGFPLYREDYSRSGTFDTCAYMGTVSGQIRYGVAAALRATGIDAVADAFWNLSIAQKPIGTGPYRLVSEDASRIHLEAWPGYHGGLAPTRYLDFVPAKGDGSDLVDGNVDIYQLKLSGTLRAGFTTAAASHGIRVATTPGDTYEALQFNVRPGRLFSDLNLRKALQLCIDLPRDVDAATGGTGTPIYGPVMPGTWAFDPTVPKPARDTAAGERLIEASGWKLGADGIYAKNGVRLVADVVVRADNAARIKMVDLVALQARDCGIDLRSRPTSWDVIQTKFFVYPYIVPATNKPFDLYIGAFGGLIEPANSFSVLASSSINDVPGKYGDNYIGFKDPALDHLLTAAMATYDQAARASLYRQAQQEVAAQLPYLYLWAWGSYDVVRTAVSTVDGPLGLTAPNWRWQPERLVVTASKP